MNLFDHVDIINMSSRYFCKVYIYIDIINSFALSLHTLKEINEKITSDIINKTVLTEIYFHGCHRKNITEEDFQLELTTKSLISLDHTFFL